jgi:hypothetical protein
MNFIFTHSLCTYRKIVRCSIKVCLLKIFSEEFLSHKNNSWLEISLRPEGPATGQLDQGFPWFSSVLEQIVNWESNFTLIEHFQRLYQNQFRSVALTPLLTSSSVHDKVHILTFYLFSLPKPLPSVRHTYKRRTSGNAWELSKPENCSALPHNKALLTAISPHFFSVSLSLTDFSNLKMSHRFISRNNMNMWTESIEDHTDNLSSSQY